MMQESLVLPDKMVTVGYSCLISFGVKGFFLIIDRNKEEQCRLPNSFALETSDSLHNLIA
jgi:hypothetical protein